MGDRMRFYIGCCWATLLSAPFWVLVVWALSTCTAEAGFYAEIGLGKNDVFDTNHWEGRSSTGCNFSLGYEYILNPDISLIAEYSHYSQCTRGNGFDSRSEDALDNFYFKARYDF